MADRDSQLGGSRSVGLPINRSDRLGGTDLQDLFRFNLSGRSSINLKLANFKKANFNVELYAFKQSFGTIPARDKRQPFLKIKNKYFQLVGASRKIGVKPESIARDSVDAGEYLIRVYGKGTSGYRLTGESQAVGQSPAPTPTPTVPTLSIASAASVAEGNAGNTNLSFAVSLSSASTRTISVNYATANGAAIAGSDYTATTGTLSFAPGETSKLISVPITGDTEVEADETFTLTLSSPANATIAAGLATGTILNDDLAPGPGPGPGPIPTPTPTPGNSLETAFAASLPNTTALTGSVSDSDTQDYYKVTINNGTDFLFETSGLQNKADIEILDGAGAKLSPDSSLISSSTLATPEKFIRRLEAGTYYFRVAQKTAGQTANYSITSRQLTDNVLNSAPNTASIDPTQPLQNFERYVGASSTADYYRFTVGDRSFLTVELTNLFGNLDVTLGKAGVSENEWAVFNSTSTSPPGTYGQGVEKFGGTLDGGTEYIMKVVAPQDSQGSTYSLAVSLNSRSTRPSITRDINFGTDGSQAVVLGTVSGLTYFSAFNGSSHALYSTNGTLDGTKLLREFAAPLANAAVTTLDNSLYFIANDGVIGNELWKLNGGTVTNVADIGTGSTGGSIQNLTAVGNTVYFRGASSAQQALKLFKTTGSGATDITGSLESNSIANLTAFGNSALFLTGTVNGDAELFRILNSSNTIEKIDLDARVDRSSNPGNLIQVSSNTLYVMGATVGTADKPALFKLTDVLNPTIGSVVKTVILNPSDTVGTFGTFTPTKSTPMALFDNNSPNNTSDDVLYFAAANGALGTQLMKVTNPVGATTVSSVALVRDTDASATVGIAPTEMTQFNGKMYFFAQDIAPDNTRTTKLWSTDGTKAGTTVVAGLSGATLFDANGGPPINDPTLTVAGQSLFFIAKTAAAGTELWKIVGNDAPELVLDINAGTGNSNPDDLIATAGGVFFLANDGTSGQELWFVGG